MKRGILVTALVVTVAGVASANLLTAASQSEVPSQIQPPARAAVPRVASARAVEPAPAPPAVAAKSAPAPVVQKASLEARQAPVPLQVKPRPPVNVPAVEEKKTAEKPADGATTEQAAAGGDALGENAAKTAIEADGYKGVKVLRKGVNGVWHATALRGKTPVTLTVDASGSVSAD
jgi:hypothetical protein